MLALNALDNCVQQVITFVLFSTEVVMIFSELYFVMKIMCLFVKFMKILLSLF